MVRISIIILISGMLLNSCSVKSGKKDKAKSAYAPLTHQEQKMGFALYRSKCMNCHMANGKGLKAFYPPLAGSDFLKKNVSKSLGMVKYGANIPIKVNGEKYQNLMPASGLQDEELVTVFNYVLNSWGNLYGRVTLEDVRKAKPQK